MTGGPRSARRLVGHQRGRLYGGRVYGTPRHRSPPADRDAAQQPPVPQVWAPRLSMPLPDRQRRALARRLWAWRLLAGGWFVVSVVVGYLAVRWVGAAALCCHLPMAGALFMLAYAAASDLRDYAASVRDTGS